MTVTKADLTERRRGKGGTLVKVVGGKWASDETLVVKDLMQRKTFDMPNRIGVGPLDRGFAFGVTLDEIVLVGKYVHNDPAGEPEHKPVPQADGTCAECDGMLTRLSE